MLSHPVHMRFEVGCLDHHSHEYVGCRRMLLSRRPGRDELSLPVLSHRCSLRPTEDRLVFAPWLDRQPSICITFWEANPETKCKKFERFICTWVAYLHQCFFSSPYLASGKHLDTAIPISCTRSPPSTLRRVGKPLGPHT